MTLNEYSLPSLLFPKARKEHLPLLAEALPAAHAPLLAVPVAKRNDNLEDSKKLKPRELTIICNYDVSNQYCMARKYLISAKYLLVSPHD